MEPIEKLTRDMRAAAYTLSKDEARFLVDNYYIMQSNRIRADSQARSMADEPHTILNWYGEQSRSLEKQIKAALLAYAESSEVGKWLLGVKGIGPVIAAGLLAHIDIEQAPTVGHIWSYAGLDPTKTWEKKTKRPWNAELKKLCWKAGESFVKVSGSDDAVYGKLYVERKALENKRNEAGDFAEQAANAKAGKDTKAKTFHEKGQLPPAHIHARAKRYAVKLFLSHLHHIWYVDHYKEDPPKPFAITMLGHAHYIKPQP